VFLRLRMPPPARATDTEKSRNARIQPGHELRFISKGVGAPKVLADVSFVSRLLSLPRTLAMGPSHSLMFLMLVFASCVWQVDVVALMATTQRLDQIASLLAGPVGHPCTSLPHQPTLPVPTEHAPDCSAPSSQNRARGGEAQCAEIVARHSVKSKHEGGNWGFMCYTEESPWKNWGGKCGKMCCPPIFFHPAFGPIRMMRGSFSALCLTAARPH